MKFEIQAVALRSAIVFFLLGLFSVFSSAQRATGTISGVVSDPSGRSISEALVTIRNLDTGYVATTRTHQDGGYVFPEVPLGNYNVAASYKGFQTEEQQNVPVTIGGSLTTNFSLRLGSVAETITVNAQGDLIDTTSNNVSEVIAETSITELPLNGRNPATLVLLSPGVGPENGGGLQGGLTHPSSTIVASNGGRQGTTGFQLDGSDNMDHYMGSAQPFPNPDATQEFRVSNLNYSAEFGFAPGAMVNVATKSGTNELHGSGFEFNRQGGFNASNWFTHSTDELRRNQFGGAIGGPVLKNRLFLFFNLQRTNDYIAPGPAFGGNLVPTQAMLSGDFSKDPNPLHDPNTGLPLVNNQIPQNEISQTALNFLSKVGIQPATNPEGLIMTPAPVTNDSDVQFTGRMDFIINSKQTVTVRAFHDEYFLNPYVSTNVLANSSGQDNYAINYSFKHVYTITPSLINSFDFTTNDTPTTANITWPPLSWQDVGVNAEIDPNFPKGLYSFWGPFGWDSADNIFNRNFHSVTDNVDWVKGRHTLKFGGTYDFQDWRMANNYLASATMYYDGSYTGDPLADFVVGHPAQFLQNGASDVTYHLNQFAGYIEDSYRLKPNLTINAGLRFEPWLPATTPKMHAFRPGQQSTVYPNAPLGLVFAGDKGITQGGTSPYINNWLPRLGFAWAPAALPNTSFRAAVGLFSSALVLSNYNNIGTEAPFSASYDVFNPPDMANPWGNYPGGDPFPAAFSTSSKLPPSSATFSPDLTIQASFPANFRPPQTVSWNLTGEHQFHGDFLARASYVGSATSHWAYDNEMNPGYWNPSIAGEPIQQRRLNYPTLGDVQQYIPEARATYEALQTQLEKRFSRGLTFTANYTYSHSYDNYSTSSFMRVVGNPFNLNWNWGPADQDLTHMFSASAVWQLPTPALSSFGKALLGGWQLSGLMTAYSGSPISISAGADYSGAGVSGDRADLVSGQNPSLPTGRSRAAQIAEYFNTTAFTTPAPGTFGDSPRGIIRGPGSKDADLALSKGFTIRDRYKFQLRWETFNSLNWVNLGNPSTNVGVKQTFGQIFSAGPPRVMQIGAKFNF